jgi:SagB-type dehydrogenase family enzyme
LDWENQPNPFRRFAGSPVLRLPQAAHDNPGESGVLFGTSRVSPQPLTLRSLGKFFELALGLSARKESGRASWYLRMNPSSGNLHPTEAYAILPPISEGSVGAGVYHYAPHEHALEQRASWCPATRWNHEGFWVALSSVTWREAWKYGERAFRYCQHDIGHALAALRFAGATVGWNLRLASRWTDAQLAHWLGLDRREDFAEAEPEIPELLARVSLGEEPDGEELPDADEPIGWQGRATRLSPSVVDWPAIDAAIQATKRAESMRGSAEAPITDAWPPPEPPKCLLTAEELICRRRSAVNFDGRTAITRGALLAILDTTLSRRSLPPFDVWPWPAQLHLVLFVHRVEGLEPGLYAWMREPDDLKPLQAACQKQFDWTPVTDSPSRQPLYQLGCGKLRDFARAVSCGQDIAADSSFSLGMLARFEPLLRRGPAAVYRELFWEAGIIGQTLYLAAEAAGVRGTGIGCYFDDVLHRALGLSGQDWQSLYHFTVGGAVDDPRLRTTTPYAHLDEGSRSERSDATGNAG